MISVSLLCTVVRQIGNPSPLQVLIEGERNPFSGAGMVPAVGRDRRQVRPVRS